MNSALYQFYLAAQVVKPVVPPTPTPAAVNLKRVLHESARTHIGRLAQRR